MYQNNRTKKCRIKEKKIEPSKENKWITSETEKNKVKLKNSHKKKTLP